MTAEATEAQVAAAMEALGCVRQELATREGSAEVVCRKHHAYTPDFKTLLEGDWTDRGCPVAVQAADAVVAAGPDPATIAADEWRTAQNVNHLRATIRTGWPALAKALNDWHEAQS
jgi:hypothetical protein